MIEESTEEVGAVIECMARECSSGLIDCIWVSTRMIRNMAMGVLFGMEMTLIGKRASNMGTEKLILLAHPPPHVG